jgi:hypothetical protein
MYSMPRHRDGEYRAALLLVSSISTYRSAATAYSVSGSIRSRKLEFTSLFLLGWNPRKAMLALGLDHFLWWLDIISDGWTATSGWYVVVRSGTR